MAFVDDNITLNGNGLIPIFISCDHVFDLRSVHVSMGRPNNEFLFCVYFLEEAQNQFTSISRVAPSLGASVQNYSLRIAETISVLSTEILKLCTQSY